MIPTFSHPSFFGRFGASQKDITPPVGINARHWGAASFESYSSVHRPLMLTVLTLRGEGPNEQPLAMISLDHCVWRTPSQEGKILRQAASRGGVPEDRIVLALTHTHSAAHLSPTMRDYEGGELVAGYLQKVAEQLESAVRDALANEQAGQLEVHTGHCTLATNRDLEDPLTGQFHVGWNPHAGADSTLLVGRVSAENGTPIATIVNYACHPTILAWENTRFSPDFPGTMREVVQTDTGAPCLFFQGASGELAPRHQYTADPAVVERAGRCLGHAVLSTLYEMQTPATHVAFEGTVESGARLAWWRESPSPRRVDTPQIRQFYTHIPLRSDIPSIEELRQQVAVCENPTEAEKLLRVLRRQEEIGESNPYVSPHALWHLGDILLLTTCHEAYSSLQKSLRAAASPLPLFVITLAEGGISSYLPPQHLYEKDIYTVSVTPFAAGCLELVTSELSRHVREFVSTPAQAPKNFIKTTNAL